MADEIQHIAELGGELDDARPSNRRLGEQIASNADIVFTSGNGATVASVGATSTAGGRTVRFTHGNDGTRWMCTCSSKQSPWCKHVVAAVLAARSC